MRPAAIEIRAVSTADEPCSFPDPMSEHESPPMRRAIQFAFMEFASIGVLFVMGAALFAPIRLDASHANELDKPSFDEPRNREMHAAAAKTIVPPAKQYLIRPSQVDIE
jgi:hypothetical protein